MKFKVLLIDDEPGAIEGLQMWVDWPMLGFEVCGTGSNGIEGLAMMERLQPDLVVTDVRMPLMSGLEMIEAWQRDGGKQVKFAVLSGFSEFEYARTSIRHGVNHYLLKPVIPEEAELALREIYDELAEATEKQSVERIARHEEIAQCLKRRLLGEPEERADPAVLSSVAAAATGWNICLVRSEPGRYADAKERALELLKRREKAYLVDLEMNCFGVVYGIGSAQEHRNEEVPRYLHAQLQPVSSRTIMAVGEKQEDLQSINKSYAAAREALRHRFYGVDDGGIVWYTNIRNRTFSVRSDVMRLVEESVAAVNLLDQAAFRLGVSTAVKGFRDRMVEPETVIKLAIHTMFRMMDLVKEAAGKQAEPLIEKYARSQGRFLPTLEDIEASLLSCGLDCITLLRSERAKQSQGIIHEINAYIRSHYHECLTIKQLAEVFYLHPAYLGQLLWKKNGIGFHEMLHNLRIEAAASLLREGSLKNSEIAERVGYGQYGQFLKQFEARMKVSPTEYRKNRS